jgi:uncharacterized protein
VELPAGELSRAVDERDRVVAAVRAAGYRYVTLDLEGLRSGNLNDVLTSEAGLHAPSPGDGSAGSSPPRGRRLPVRNPGPPAQPLR